jgi:hypothetical protein
MHPTLRSHFALVAFAACAAASVLLSACAGGGASPSPGPARTGDATAAQAAAPAAAPRGPQVRVTWEALARERELLEDSKHRRAGVVQAEPRVVLVSESHVDAARVRTARTPAERAQLAGAAVVPDADLVALVQGLERRGFFRHARSTGSLSALLASESARGVVTIERDGESVSLVSLRGQGQHPATREIPAIYSEAKRAILLLRNRTPMLNLSSVSRGSLQTSPPSGR